MLDTYNRVQRATQQLTARQGREPTMEELAHETGLTTEKLDRIKKDWAETPFSLDKAADTFFTLLQAALSGGYPREAIERMAAGTDDTPLGRTRARTVVRHRASQCT